MTRRFFFALVLVISCFISGCAVIPMKPTPTPDLELDDLAVRYHWQEGSLPPPYHYEYEIRIGPGNDGDIVFYPDYPGRDTPVWTDRFTITGQQRAQLINLIQDNQILTRTWHPLRSPPVGGSLQWMELTAGDLRVSVPSQIEEKEAVAVAPVYDAIRSLVPQSTWDSLIQRRDKYRDEHSR